MNFFRYIFLSILSFLSTNIYASCPSGNSVVSETFAGNVGSLYCVQYYSSNCEVLVQSGTIILDGGPLPYASLTGKTCEYIEKPPLQEGCTQLPNGSIECEEEEPEPTVLVCTASSCLNPNNLQCPTNYVSGSVNGRNVCVRNDEPDPDPEPNECEDEDCSTEEIAAIRDAKHGIIDSIQQLGDTIRNGFNDLMNLLDEKLSSQPSGDGDGSGETGSSNVDTSSLNAETPTKDLNIENAQFNDGIYNSIPSCPDDKQLNLDLMGRSFSYSFSFSHFCDGLSIVGIFIMIMCYLYSAYIVIKE